MNTNLTVLLIMIAVASTTTISATTTTIATQEIFAQNQSTYMEQLINECMYNNVTACNALEHYNYTESP